MNERNCAASRALSLLSLLALVAVWPGTAWAQPNGNASNIIPTLDIVGLIGLGAAVGGVGLLGLRARRQGRRKP
jgi:TRAP-type C4-dicarboxylate transport system permease small subunit